MNASALTSLLADARELPLLVLVTRVQQLLADAGPNAGSSAREAVRFRHDAGLGFHTSDVLDATLEHEDDDAPRVAITTGLLGLTGATSPLPLSWIEQHAHDGEPSVECAFLDLFHHRLLSLLCRGLLTSDLTDAAGGGRAHLAAWSLQLAGLPPEHAPRIASLPPDTLFWLSPLLVSWPPSARRIEVALDALLDEVLGAARGDTRVRVRELTGGQCDVPAPERPLLGGLRLGVAAVLGSRMAVPASGLTVEIGPLSAHACRLLAPSTELGRRCAAVVALLTPETVRAVIALQPARTSGLRLGRPAAAALGQASWLGRSGTPEPVRFHAC